MVRSLTLLETNILSIRLVATRGSGFCGKTLYILFRIANKLLGRDMNLFHIIIVNYNEFIINSYINRYLHLDSSIFYTFLDYKLSFSK